MGFIQTYGWAVGNPDWLNSDASKVERYWRVIEEGSAATGWPWEGQTVVGLWGPNAGPRGALRNGELSPFGSASDQKFVPFFRSRTGDMLGAARAALYYFFDGGHGANMDLLNVEPRGKQTIDQARRSFYFWLMTHARIEQMPFVHGVIINPVPAGHYYNKAVESFNPMEREMAEIVRIFGRNVFSNKDGPVEPSSRAGLTAARQQIAFLSDTPAKAGPRSKGGVPAGFEGGSAPLYTYRASPVIQDLTRNALGQFTTYQVEIVKINQKLAREFQEHLVELMSSEHKRPVSGDLMRATADPQNRTPV